MAEAWLWPIALGGLGLIFGSFIATVAIRLPEGRSPLQGRSQCDGCHAMLAPLQLLPLLSYAAQRGRCRHCGSAIAIVHPVVEALAMGIGVAAGLVSPDGAGAAGAVFGWQLLLLGALDLRALWLPNWGTGLLALTGIAVGALEIQPPLIDRLIGGVAGFAVLWIVAFIYRRVRGRVGLGGGDPKLVGAIGAWIGWAELPLLVLTACGIGLVVVLAMLLAKREVAATTRLPFGTLLAFSAFPIWVTLAIELQSRTS